MDYKSKDRGGFSYQSLILENLKIIDQYQKEAIIKSHLQIFDSPLIEVSKDTTPISFYFTDGKLFTTNVSQEQINKKILNKLNKNKESYIATQYRIEEVKTNSLIIRSLINYNNQTFTTNQILVIDLQCIAAIETHDSVNCNFI